MPPGSVPTSRRPLPLPQRQGDRAEQGSKGRSCGSHCCGHRGSDHVSAAAGTGQRPPCLAVPARHVEESHREMPPPGQQHQRRSGQGREPHGHCLLRSPILPASHWQSPSRSQLARDRAVPWWGSACWSPKWGRKGEDRGGGRRKPQMNNVLHICLRLQPAECPGPKSLHPTPISAPF